MGLVDFLVSQERPGKKLKLYGNNITSLRSIIVLLEDPVCGILNDSVSLQELHIGSNEIPVSELEDMLDAIAQLKGPEPMSPPLWLRVERNGFSPDALDEVVERLRDRLNICFLLGRDCTTEACEANADVHVVFQGQ